MCVCETECACVCAAMIPASVVAETVAGPRREARPFVTHGIVVLLM